MAWRTVIASLRAGMSSMAGNSHMPGMTVLLAARAGNVAVDYGDRFVMRDGGNGGSSVGSDAVKVSQPDGRDRHFSGMFVDDGLRRSVQHAGAAVVAKSAPEGENVLLVGGGQR